MARKKFDELNIPSLCEAMRRARLAMRRPRQTIVDMAREVAGAYWSEEGAPRDVIVNLLSLYQTTFGRTLIPKNPRVMLSTFRRSLKPTIAAMETWANQHIQKIKLSNEIRKVVVNGLYSMGISQVSLADPAMAANVGWGLRAGEAFIRSIDFDDYVCDVHARDMSEFAFEGYRYRVPYEAVRDSKFYTKWLRRDLSPSFDPLFNETGDERISALGRTMYAADTEEYDPMVDLWFVYLNRHKRCLILADDQIHGPLSGDLKGEPLREFSWIGPERGPLLKLGYGIIPGNWMPKGPMQDGFKLHQMMNASMRKLDRTINNRLKEITLIREAAAQRDGDAVLNANDGDLVPVMDPQNFSQVVMGGQHAQLLTAMAEQFKNSFDFIMGNLSLLGGRGPQSRTATQDRMLDENANASVQDLQDQTIDYVAEVLRSFCWYWWHDPQLVMHTKHSISGLPDMDTNLRVFPNGWKSNDGHRPLLERKGDFAELDINVDPYSLQHSSPGKKLQDLNQTVQTIILPMMQLMVQQGKSFDIDAYLQKIGRWSDDPDLADLITIEEPPEMDAGPRQRPQSPMRPPAQDTLRHNVSERTPQSDSQNLIASMMGHSVGGDNRNGKSQPMKVM